MAVPIILILIAKGAGYGGLTGVAAGLIGAPIIAAAPLAGKFLFGALIGGGSAAYLMGQEQIQEAQDLEELGDGFQLANQGAWAMGSGALGIAGASIARTAHAARIASGHAWSKHRSDWRVAWLTLA